MQETMKIQREIIHACNTLVPKVKIFASHLGAAHPSQPPGAKCEKQGISENFQVF